MNSKNSKGGVKTIVMWVVAVIVAIFLVGWAIWATLIAAPKYHAVSLTTGEVYFGQLQQFPSYGLKNVYTIQVNAENEEQPLSIQKFSNVFWGPGNFLKINRDNVVWTVELTDESQLTQLLQNNPDLAPQQQQQGGAQVPANAGQQVPAGE